MQRGSAEEAIRPTPSLLTRSKAFMGDLLSRPHSASTSTSRASSSFPKVAKAVASNSQPDSSSAVTRARLSKAVVPPNSTVMTRTRFSKTPVVPPIKSPTKVEHSAPSPKKERSGKQPYCASQHASIEAPATQFRYKTPPAEDLLKQLSDHSLVHCHGGTKQAHSKEHIIFWRVHIRSQQENEFVRACSYSLIKKISRIRCLVRTKRTYMFTPPFAPLYQCCMLRECGATPT